MSEPSKNEKLSKIFDRMSALFKERDKCDIILKVKQGVYDDCKNSLFSAYQNKIRVLEEHLELKYEAMELYNEIELDNKEEERAAKRQRE